MSETYFDETFDPVPILDTVPREAEMLTDPGAVVDLMKTHPEMLARAGLEHLVWFSRVYGDVTLRAYRRLEEGKYNRPDVVAKAIPHFAQRWHNHLNHYADGDKGKLPGIWLMAFDDPRMRAAEPATQMGVPMTGHIGFDLEETVEYVKAPRRYKPDFTFHIGGVLSETARFQAKYLLPINFFARHAIAQGVQLPIAGGREFAWYQGKRLIAAGDDEVARQEIFEQSDQYSQLCGDILLNPGNLTLKGIKLALPTLHDLRERVDF